MTRMLAFALLTLAAFSPAPVRAQQQRLGPWDNDLWIAESPDGTKFGTLSRFVERGGVPTMVRDAKGRLIAAFQWFPFEREEAFDRVAVAISSDGGKTWADPQPIVVEGLPEGYERPFDPTLVPLEDGRLRLYYSCRDRRKDDPPATYSALSSDGVRYTFEPGVRFAIEDEPVIDCAAVRFQGKFHYFAPVQGPGDGRGYHAVSDDGLSFQRLEDVKVPGNRRWLGCAVDLGDRIRFYGSGRGVWSAVSTDGATWTLDEGGRTRNGADPAVAPSGDGRFLIVVTGEPRDDAGTRRPPHMESPGGMGVGQRPDGPEDHEGPGGHRDPMGPPPIGGSALVSVGDFLCILSDGSLRKIDPQTMKVVAELSLVPQPGHRPPEGVEPEDEPGNRRNR